MIKTYADHLHGVFVIKDALSLSGSNEILRLRRQEVDVIQPITGGDVRQGGAAAETSALEQPILTFLCLRYTCHKNPFACLFVSNCTHKSVKDWHFTTIQTHIAAGRIL